MILCSIVIVACIGLGSASPAKDPPKKSPCADVCTSDYTPVCGSPGSGDGNSQITFGNKCVMEKYNCESKKCKFAITNFVRTLNDTKHFDEF